MSPIHPVPIGDVDERYLPESKAEQTASTSEQPSDENEGGPVVSANPSEANERGGILRLCALRSGPSVPEVMDWTDGPLLPAATERLVACVDRIKKVATRTVVTDRLQTLLRGWRGTLIFYVLTDLLLLLVFWVSIFAARAPWGMQIPSLSCRSAQYIADCPSAPSAVCETGRTTGRMTHAASLASSARYAAHR